MRIIVTALCLVLLASCVAQSSWDGAKARVADPLLKEASGLAVSPEDPQFLWALNDSGADAHLHLMGTNGADRGVLRLKGVRNADWEDLAAFRRQDRNYLLIADVGDNAAKRNHVTLHLVREPTLPVANVRMDRAMTPEWSMNFRYEDGPRDCESVAVDVQAGKILLLSKRTRPPVLYELPLSAPKANEILTAKRLGTMTRLPLPKISLPHPHGSQPTAMDISPDGRKAAILTYRGVFLVSRPVDQSWQEAFQNKPQPIAAHSLPQAEALAFDRSGKFVYVTSEGSNPELLRFPVP